MSNYALRYDDVRGNGSTDTVTFSLKKLRGLSPQAHYADRSTAVCQQS
jgi:hypothetical protein